MLIAASTPKFSGARPKKQVGIVVQTTQGQRVIAQDDFNRRYGNGDDEDFWSKLKNALQRALDGE